MPEPDFEALLYPPSPRWPTKGDRLLSESDDWNTGVSFPNNEWMRHIQIMDGFMLAADRLIESARGDARIDREMLLFPVLANYRHAVELGLKWLLLQYGTSLGIERTDVDDAGHNVWVLWCLLRPIIETGDAEQDASIAAATQVVKDLHDLDPNAMSLRYWTNKNGEAFKLPSGRYDLGRTREVMKGMSDLFNSLDAWLDALVSAQPDW